MFKFNSGTALQGKEMVTSSWRVPMNTPNAVANHIVVAAFTPPSRPTIQALEETMPQGSSLQIICPQAVRKPKGKFQCSVLKGSLLLAVCSHVTWQVLVVVCVIIRIARDNNAPQFSVAFLCSVALQQ